MNILRTDQNSVDAVGTVVATTVVDTTFPVEMRRVEALLVVAKVAALYSDWSLLRREASVVTKRPQMHCVCCLACHRT